MAIYTVALAKLMHDLDMKSVYLPVDAEDILISVPDVSRAGLELNGFLDFFDPRRIQIFGRTEIALLDSFSPERRANSLESFFSRKPMTIIFTRGYEPAEDIVESAQKYKVPLVVSPLSSSNLLATLVSELNVELAPRITRHGVMMEVYGEGILIVGDSGVGKSETAIELLKRGHRLIADDAVEIRRVSSKTLVASAPENIRHFIELRGIGIINARRAFGISAVKLTESIDLCINLEAWDNTKIYDRMGTGNEFADFLGIKVPLVTIPVRPGRNLAVIIEIAAVNSRDKKMGYDATKDLLANLGMDYTMIEQPARERKLDI